jgi:hypothetical protein
MSGVRQAIAVNIIFFTVRYAHQKAPFKYHSLVLLASLFHVSALVMIFLYHYLQKRIDRKIILSFLCIGTIIHIFRISWIKLVLERLTSVFPDTAFALKVLNYTTNDYLAQESRMSLMLFMNIAVFLVCLKFRNTLAERHRYFNLFFNMYILFIFTTIYIWESGEISTRLGFYFLLGFVIALSLCISLVKVKINILAVLAFIVMLNFNNSRDFFLEAASRLPYNPYQNYYIHQFFELESTGPNRLDEYINYLDKSSD